LEIQSLTDHVVAMLRGQITDIVVGSIFLFIGLTASATPAECWSVFGTDV
jgi:hypothetical protein